MPGSASSCTEPPHASWVHNAKSATSVQGRCGTRASRVVDGENHHSRRRRIPARRAHDSCLATRPQDSAKPRKFLIFPKHHSRGVVQGLPIRAAINSGLMHPRERLDLIHRIK